MSQIIDKYNLKILLSLIFFISACTISKSSLSNHFDKKLWQSNSSYRYDAIKKKEFFAMIEGKSKKQIKRILGLPDLINDEGKYVYCLDIKPAGEKCEGSALIIGFEKGNPYNITVLR